MNGYVLSTAADLDLDDIWEYIAQDNLDAANRWIASSMTPSTHWREIRKWGINGRISSRIKSCSGRSAHT